MLKLLQNQKKSQSKREVCIVGGISFTAYYISKKQIGGVNYYKEQNTNVHS